MGIVSQLTVVEAGFEVLCVNSILFFKCLKLFLPVR